MKKVLFLLIVMVCSCSPIEKLYNDLGETRELQQYASKIRPVRIYFDRWGYVYPNFKIKDSLFRFRGSALDSVYRMEHSILLGAYKSEGLIYDAAGSSKENIEKLQLHLDEKYAELIDSMAIGKKLVFLIHGYNNDGTSAAMAFSRLELAMHKLRRADDMQFVEIYWDGLYRGKNMLNSAKIWNNAQYSASLAALGLRRVLNRLRSEQIYVVTHSQGAAVITEALFNAQRFSTKFYTADKDGKEIVSLRNSPLYDSPSADFTVGMIVPAIPGMNVFEEYYCRTVGGRQEIVADAQYRFINGFNKHDQITSKWKFSTLFGSTSLASREKEHEAVSVFFQADTNIYDRVNFSISRGSRQTSHGVKDYVDNENFPSFVRRIFDSPN